MTIPNKIGRYEIIDELGHGAMGSVFRAHDPAMDRTVALKTILSAALASDEGSEYRQRFYREARSAGALAHPGIVAVFDVGDHEGVPYLVMEFVDGLTLEEAAKRGERPSLNRACEIGQQVAEALGYAHHHGIIHRDIKPANILLTSREVYGVERAKITDFGVAKLASETITTTGRLLGTPAYMPPEQFTGSPIDSRTDLFSLGVILYWMTTGEQPFAGESMTAVSYKVVHTEPIPPSKLNPAVPIELERVILKCLEKNPANRYQTGEELAQDLENLRAGGMGSGLRATAPRAAVASTDSDETVDSSPGLAPVAVLASVSASTAQTSKEIPVAGPVKKRGGLVPSLVALAALAALGGGYFLLHWGTAAQAPQKPAAVAAPASQLSPVPVQAAAPAPNGTAGVSKDVPAPAAASVPATVSAPAAASVTGPAHTRAASVAFNPKTLDPKLNARLKIDLGHCPASLGFLVEMNGKTYFKGSTGKKADYDVLFVPPGVQEFRVTLSSNKVHRVSNIVSAEFAAKKHLTLKVDLRAPANGAASLPGALDPTAQVVASLKPDHFPL